jgi:hypothetical protein
MRKRLLNLAGVLIISGMGNVLADSLQHPRWLIKRRNPVLSTGYASVKCSASHEEAIDQAKRQALKNVGDEYVQVGNWITSSYVWMGWYGSPGDCSAIHGNVSSVFVPAILTNAPYSFNIERSFANKRLNSEDSNAGHETSEEKAWSKAQKLAESDIRKLCKTVKSVRVVSKSITRFDNPSWYDPFSVNVLATCIN